jgi:hypothetical protein
MFRYKLRTLLIVLAVALVVLVALYAIGFVNSKVLLGGIGLVMTLVLVWAMNRTQDTYSGGHVVRSPRPPTYEELRDLFLFLESPPENDHFPYPDWIQLLVDAKLLTWRSTAHMGVTALGREVAKRLRAGGDSHEIRRVLDPTA